MTASDPLQRPGAAGAWALQVGPCGRYRPGHAPGTPGGAPPAQGIFQHLDAEHYALSAVDHAREEITKLTEAVSPHAQVGRGCAAAAAATAARLRAAPHARLRILPELPGVAVRPQRCCALCGPPRRPPPAGPSHPRLLVPCGCRRQGVGGGGGAHGAPAQFCDRGGGRRRGG